MNTLKTLFTAFNNLRRHNINMNTADLLNGLRSKYIHKLRRDALKKLVNKNNQAKKLSLFL